MALYDTNHTNYTTIYPDHGDIYHSIKQQQDNTIVFCIVITENFDIFQS